MEFLQLAIAEADAQRRTDAGLSLPDESFDFLEYTFGCLTAHFLAWLNQPVVEPLAIVLGMSRDTSLASLRFACRPDPRPVSGYEYLGNLDRRSQNSGGKSSVTGPHRTFRLRNYTAP